MPAPANDDFYSASPLLGDHGKQAGDNTDATAQTGEPASYGRTLWYAWTAPNVFWMHPFFFSTRADPFDRASYPAAPCDTVVRIFRVLSGSGPLLGRLQEVTYRYCSLTHRANGWEHASEVVFIPDKGVTYYIRVDGFAGAQGPFLLWWGKYRHKHPGRGPVWTAVNKAPAWTSYDIGRCWAPGIQHYMAHVMVGDVKQNDLVQNFGTFNPGNYVVRYHSGAWVNDSSFMPPAGQGFPFPEWVVWKWDGLAGNWNGGNWIEVLVNGIPIRHLEPITNLPWAFIGGEAGAFASQEYNSYGKHQSAEWWASGSHCPITLTTRSLIQLHFTDDALTPDDANAHDTDPQGFFWNPTFILYRLPD